MEQTENWARVTFYRGKEKLRKEIVACDIKVDGNKLTVSASMIDSMAAISSMNFKEVNGEIDIEIRVVKSSIFYNGTVKKSYIASKKIKSVRQNTRIFWVDGENISSLTSEVYNSKHDYIGDTVENLLTAETLGISAGLGSFKNELKTDKEPYEWILLMENEIHKESENYKIERMKNYAYVLLGTIYNLDTVTYKYKVDGKEHELSITKDKATQYAGFDIKDCYDNAACLQKLMDKIGFDS